MSLPDVSQRPWVPALPQAQVGAMAQTAAASVAPGDLSGFRLIASGAEAWQARLELIERARVSLDLQVYQFKGDAAGRTLMRALRDAAARGVRVRVLLDDLYTAGDDALWLALSAQPGLEVRLFNPFLAGRDSHLSRLLESALGDERMHRRMHNKMLVADGVMALAGGRNIADAYFAPPSPERLVDIDVLVAGAVVTQMALGFDLYWNSDYSHALRDVLDVALGAPPLPEPPAVALGDECRTPACQAAERARRSESVLAREFAQGRVAMRMAVASVAFDSPDKIENEQVATDLGMLATSGAQVRLLVAQAMLQAQQELMVVSPYLIPGDTGARAIADFRRRGVRVMLLTNSLAATDEPTVHLGYRKYRVAILREGAELYEWSPARGGRVLRELVAGGTVLRLHAKAAVVDRRLVYLGSMNFDPRSRDLNTEFGLLIRSPELAEELRALIERLAREGAYRLHLDADGRTLRWSTGDGDAVIRVDEPDTDFGSRLLLDLLEPLVPEEML
jgi:cardiolipin synthase C